MKKLFAILSMLLAILFLLTAGSFWYFLSNWYDDVEQEYITQKSDYATKISRTVPQMKEDQNVLSKYPWFKTQKCINDAGPILNRLIAWDGDSLDWLSKNPPEEIIDWPQLVKEGDVRVDMVPKGEHWMDKGQKVDFSKWKFVFVQSLRDKDCWNFTKNSPIEGHSFKDYRDYADNFITPDGSSLIKVANVLLLQISKPTSGEPSEDIKNVALVLQDVRKLGILCIQSQEMVLMMIGTSILDRERTAFEYLRSKGRAPDNWSVLSQDEIKKAKRLIWTGSSLVKLFTPPEFHPEITSEDFTVGRCSSIREGLQLNVYLKDTIETEQYQWFDSVLKKGQAMGCHLDDVEEIWNNPKVLLRNDPDFSEFWMPRKVMEGYAMVVASMGGPDDFKSYP